MSCRFSGRPPTWLRRSFWFPSKDRAKGYPLPTKDEPPILGAYTSKAKLSVLPGNTWVSWL